MIEAITKVVRVLNINADEKTDQISNVISLKIKKLPSHNTYIRFNKAENL
tara:strand:+ start:46 stop:195 length:150 start_codon:yes stop_codon:yes gene_type:complete